LPNEGPKSDVSGIQADSDDAGFDSKPVEVNDPDSFQESTDAEEDIAADTKHSITPPPPDNAIFESEDSNGDNQDADILTEIRTDEPEDTPSDDPFYIPEDSQTLAAVSKIAELQNEAEGQETEQEEEVYKPTLSEDFKVGNISGKKGKKNSGAVSDSKGRKKETSGKNQASPILWILLLAATILIGFGVWWYLTQTQVQPWPTAGELPVAGLSQAMTDEIPAGLPPESETMVDEAATAGSVPVDDAVLDETPVAVTQPDAPAETAAPTTTATSSPTSSAEEGSVVQAEQPATARQAPPTTGTASTEFGLMGELQSFNQPVYGIVIHSLASREEGNFICREIREQGIRCSVVQATTSAGRVTYRVALGQFEYVAHAQQAISDLPRQYQREGIWPARIN
jgi:septal ring-binding cell division protein DamX